MANLWWSLVFVELHPEKWVIDISKSPICHHSFELFATRTEIINRVFSKICYQSGKKPLLRRHYWVKPYRLVYCTCLYVFQFPPAKWVLTYTAPSTILVLPPPRSDVWREGGKERVKSKNWCLFLKDQGTYSNFAFIFLLLILANPQWKEDGVEESAEKPGTSKLKVIFSEFSVTLPHR